MNVELDYDGVYLYIYMYIYNHVPAHECAREYVCCVCMCVVYVLGI